MSFDGIALIFVMSVGNIRMHPHTKDLYSEADTFEDSSHGVKVMHVKKFESLIHVLFCLFLTSSHDF